MSATMLTPCAGLGEVRLDCGACTACCRDGKVWLTPDDDVARYEGNVVSDISGLHLARKPNGDCIYLDRKRGCTIYDDRPVSCAEFDCRRVVKALMAYPRKARRSSSVSRDVQRAGRRRLHTLTETI